MHPRSCADRGRFEPVVVALIDDLRVADGVVAVGIPLRVMGMRPGVPDPRAVLRLARFLRRERPQVVQTWMDHSNLIGGMAARLAPGPPRSGGCTTMTSPGYERTTSMTVAACARLSRRLPTRVVCCSESARAA